MSKPYVGPAADLSRMNAEFVEQVARAHSAAASVWCDLALSVQEFATWLLTRDPGEQLVTGLSELATDDLYLVCGCMHADRAALQHFEDLLQRVAPPAVARMKPSSSEVTDLVDHLRDLLLVGDGPSSRPRLASYHGSGPLRAWLRVVAAREAVTRVRRDQRERARQRHLADAVRESAAAPDTQLMEEACTAAFKQAFEQTLAELSGRERTLLRLRYLEELGIDKLASLYNVHRATAARWLVAIRAKLLTGTRQRLAAVLSLSPTEVDSVIRMLDSELYASVRRYLSPSPQT